MKKKSNKVLGLSLIAGIAAALCAAGAVCFLRRNTDGSAGK